MIKNFLNLGGHQNPFSGSKFTAILLKGWIWPIGGASTGEGLPCSLRSRLVLILLGKINWARLNTLSHFQYFLKPCHMFIFKVVTQ